MTKEIHKRAVILRAIRNEINWCAKRLALNEVPSLYEGFAMDIICLAEAALEIRPETEIRFDTSTIEP